MRYAKIDEYELVNGKLAGVSLYTQGCHFRCPNCFNPETWDCNSGKEWTEEVQNKFFEMINKPFIKRVTILGGDPLHENNIGEVFELIIEIRQKFPNKTIWLYTGFTWEELTQDLPRLHMLDYLLLEEYEKKDRFSDEEYRAWQIFNILKYVDVLVDGRYIDELRDISLRWRGSNNQRVINVQESFKQNKVILHCD